MAAELFNYSKWDNLAISDDSDQESFPPKINLGRFAGYTQSQMSLKLHRCSQLMNNHIIPFEETFEFSQDSFDDSDFEFEKKSNKAFENMEFQEFANIRMQNNFKAKMELHTRNQIIRKAEINRLNELHSQQIKSNDTLLKSDYILYIYLQGITPRIWRKIRVPSTISLAAFHDKILTPLFSWKRNFHSYLFLEQKRANKMISYGPTDSQSSDMTHIGGEGNYWYQLGSIIIDSQMVHLCDVLNQSVNELRYVYDLGDAYFHKIILQKIIPRRKNKPIVYLINGQKGYPIENTKGNRGFVERLNKLNDLSVSQSDFEEIVINIVNAPNFGPGYGGVNMSYDISIFDIDYVRKQIRKYFHKRLTRQDAICMMRFPYGKYCYAKPEVVAKYKKGQDKEDSKEWFEKMCGARRCVWCQKYDKRYGGQARQTIYKCCKGCLNVFYCSRKCQKKDWNCKHRYYCFDHSRFW